MNLASSLSFNSTSASRSECLLAFSSLSLYSNGMADSCNSLLLKIGASIYFLKMGLADEPLPELSLERLAVEST